jgi:outer membrane biogenesis lipoprotein LolB
LSRLKAVAVVALAATLLLSACSTSSSKPPAGGPQPSVDAQVPAAVASYYEQKSLGHRAGLREATVAPLKFLLIGLLPQATN